MSNTSSVSTTTKQIEQIIDAIDSSTMLGAAWDCLSEAARQRFKIKLAMILDDETLASMLSIKSKKSYLESRSSL